MRKAITAHTPTLHVRHDRPAQSHRVSRKLSQHDNVFASSHPARSSTSVKVGCKGMINHFRDIMKMDCRIHKCIYPFKFYMKGISSVERVPQDML